MSNTLIVFLSLLFSSLIVLAINLAPFTLFNYIHIGRTPVSPFMIHFVTGIWLAIVAAFVGMYLNDYRKEVIKNVEITISS